MFYETQKIIEQSEIIIVLFKISGKFVEIYAKQSCFLKKKPTKTKIETLKKKEKIIFFHALLLSLARASLSKLENNFFLHSFLV